jgi:hypothetical protein
MYGQTAYAKLNISRAWNNFGVNAAGAAAVLETEQTWSEHFVMIFRVNSEPLAGRLCRRVLVFS